MHLEAGFVCGPRYQFYCISQKSLSLMKWKFQFSSCKMNRIGLDLQSSAPKSSKKDRKKWWIKVAEEIKIAVRNCSNLYTTPLGGEFWPVKWSVIEIQSFSVLNSKILTIELNTTRHFSRRRTSVVDPISKTAIRWRVLPDWWTKIRNMIEHLIRKAYKIGQFTRTLKLWGAGTL